MSGESEKTATKQNSLTYEIWKRFKKNKTAMLDLAIFSVMMILAVFADVVCGYDIQVIAQSVTGRLRPPSVAHQFGANAYGRGIFTRIVHGTRISIVIGLVATVGSVCISEILGSIAGYYGDRVDSVIICVLNTFLATPGGLLAMAIVTSPGPSITNLLIVVTVARILPFTRVIRSSILTMIDQGYIETAIASGAGDSYIIVKRILLSVMGSIIVQAAMGVGRMILIVAGIGFIGMGAQSPLLEWSFMLAEGRDFMRYPPCITLPPGLAIILTSPVLNLLGDGLRDTLGPKLKDQGGTSISGALLEIKDLNTVYQANEETVHVVNCISLTIHTRETLDLVSETGAGKIITTLAIIRLLPERIGRMKQEQMLLGGENPLNLEESGMLSVRGQKIVMIFQDLMISLNPVFTVEDQILEISQFHNHNNLSWVQTGKEVEGMPELVGIPATGKNRYPHEFFGGMKQRVMTAMALTCNPRLLIADESTTVLSVTIRTQALGMMEKLKGRFGTSMLLITYDLGVVAQTYDRVAIMYAGKIVEHGTIKDIFTGKRHHFYTQDLSGSILSMTGDAKRLDPIAGLVSDPTNLLQGCKFHVRYPHCMGTCRYGLPPVCKEGTHEIACHLFVGKENVTFDGEEVMRI